MQFSGPTYVSVWFVGWLFVTSAFTSSSLQKCFPHYYRGTHEMMVMRFTKSCQDLPRRLLVLSVRPPLSSDLSSSDLYTCGSRMKHFAGKKTFGHKTRGPPVRTSTLLIFPTRESNTKCIAWRGFPVGLSIVWSNRDLFSIPGCFVHVCRSNMYDCNTPIDVTCWQTAGLLQNEHL